MSDSATEAKAAAESAAEAARKFTAEAEKVLADIAKKAEAAVREAIVELRDRSRGYADAAGEQVETAQRYVVDRVQERPVSTTLTALGVGVLLGYLLAGKKR
jgi:ElaB/YqjD/DUF883 family membrane-anchored ribosome-binding protein